MTHPNEDCEPDAWGVEGHDGRIAAARATHDEATLVAANMAAALGRKHARPVVPLYRALPLPLTPAASAPADDAVARARDRVVEAAKVYVRNSRTGRNCADEYYTTHREEDEESIHDAVDALLAAERDAKGGERG